MSAAEHDAVSKGAAAAMAGLKDFQRATVDHVFERLYGARAGRRFLVADEVGLGKTLVARGVAARAIEHLRDKRNAGHVERVDIVYVCSNAEIARQNTKRLGLEGKHVSTRLTLLPETGHRLVEGRSGVNLVSLTPGTSFHLKGGFGQMRERWLLYAMLREVWDLDASVAPLNVLQGNVTDPKTFRCAATDYDLKATDGEGTSTRAFADHLQRRIDQAKQAGEPDLRSRFGELLGLCRTARQAAQPEVHRQAARWVGEMRWVLAASNIALLKPDLIILDEFQRFSHLLMPDSLLEDGSVREADKQAAFLARELFAFPDARVLLLSATPYKMYTAAGESEQHYRDFVRTLGFLEQGLLPEHPVAADAPQAAGLEQIMRDYRDALISLDGPESEGRLQQARRAVETRLRQVMVRTERLASTPDRNGMLQEIQSADCSLQPAEVHDYLALHKLGAVLEQPQVLEYWKSTPYVLSFMPADHYKLKDALVDALEEDPCDPELVPLIAGRKSLSLAWSDVKNYRPIDPNNSRMRALLADTVDKGAYRLLWMPPALPYYRPAGVFAEPSLQRFTKRLVFSAWRMVPRAIAAILSHEAERRMNGREGSDANTPEARKKRRPLLRFSRTDDRRLTGMPVLALIYPSAYLARACDPARLATELVSERAQEVGAVPAADLRVEAADVLALARLQIELALARVPAGLQDGPPDERWYWAAPLLLDRALEPQATAAWFGQDALAQAWAGEDADDGSEAWHAHVDEARRMAMEDVAPAGAAGPTASSLGKRPDDLVEVLAEIAVAAPGTTMLRAVLRVAGLQASQLGEEGGVRVRTAAAHAAWGFRALFNQPDVIDSLRGYPEPNESLPYWRQVLRYCLDGGLQAVLDEYAHLLRDDLGLHTGSAAERVHEIAERMSDALSLRRSNLGVDDIRSRRGSLKRNTRRMGCQFAIAFGDEQDLDASEPSHGTSSHTRAEVVRRAFNSPFWPFVLATTSVGQEGLDFHPYCHAVVHWNLPSNPVDFEQREGRVHRYKGHAVRKNVAMVHGASALASHAPDPWEVMFEAARRGRPEGATDIVPFWVYPVEGGAKIERHVPALPLSRERQRIRELADALVVYRMAFGQPRQDDLLAYLSGRIGVERLGEVIRAAGVDLGPG